MLHLQMAPQDCPAKAAFEADDIVALHRSADWYRRPVPARLRHGRRYALPKAAKRSVHLDDQCYQLARFDLVMPHIAADDACDPIKIDTWRRILFGH